MAKLTRNQKIFIGLGAIGVLGAFGWWLSKRDVSVNPPPIVPIVEPVPTIESPTFRVLEPLPPPIIRQVNIM